MPWLTRLPRLLVLLALLVPFHALSPVLRVVSSRPADSSLSYLPLVTGGAPSPVVLAGAGDVADCAYTADTETSALLDGIPGVVFTLGDNAYEDGSSVDFANCYEPTWGRHRDRTRPAPGNHDYGTSGAAGYFAYYGAAAGDPSQGYYSYNLGSWHVVVLNSNCSDVAGGCGAGSPQEQWLRQDLATYPAPCTLAYFHHPLFSSGRHGAQAVVRPLWQALYDARADVVLSGHDHHYERFALQDPQGNVNPARGLREFVAGTGGTNLRVIGTPQPNSQVRDDDSHGVLKLTLYADHYDWRFIPVPGDVFTDTGTSPCH